MLYIYIMYIYILQAALDGRYGGIFVPDLRKIALEKCQELVGAEGWGVKGGQDLVGALRVSPDDETHQLLKKSPT